ncbi:hypothetical protein J2W79_000561 [Methylorubrum extorquens]|nr:hypothetical protein [Methylorubrum extorquens]
MPATAEQTTKAQKPNQPEPAHIEVVIAISRSRGILLRGCRIGVILLSKRRGSYESNRKQGRGKYFHW